MKRTTKQISSIGFLIGIMFFLYSVYSFFADDYTMTDEQYACEAMKIVNDSRQPSQQQVQQSDAFN